MKEASGTGAPRLVRQVTRDEVPDGYHLHGDHFALAVTPLSADFHFGKHMPDGFAAAARAFALGSAPPEFIVIDGFVYGTVIVPPPVTPEEINRFEALARADWPRQRLQQWHDDLHRSIVAEVRRLRAIDLTALDNAALLEQIRQRSDRVSEWYGVHFTNSQMASQLLARCYFFCRDHFSLDDKGFLDLLAGVSDATTDAAHLLDRLAAEAHDKPDVLAALDTSDPWSVVALRDHLTPYVEAHGHTALDQSDYAAPTLIEQPTRIVQLFREARERHARGQRVTPDSGAREELVRTLRAQLGSDALRAEFDTLLGEAQAVYGVRDTDISLVFQAMGLLRYALLEAGRRLAAARVLVSPSDVWFLRRDELEDALAGTVPADLSAKATERRAEHERRSTVRPPSRFGTPPEGFPPRPSGLAPEAQRALEASAWSEGLGRRQRGAGSDVADELRGRGASKGAYSGPARIVLSEADFDKVQHGDVLVSKFTMPSWNVVLTRVRAIVTDEGGIMAHAAIVAREFGIPAVVGTRDATTKLTDGQVVSVDGAAGVVRF